MTRHGFKDATTRTEIIAGWWRRWPQANIAIPTGVVFDVLDLDGPEGVAAVRTLVDEHSLELSGLVVRTGSGGWHYLLAPTGQTSRVRLLEGVDWRGAGGYVIAPPSRHITGQCYQCVRPLDLDTLPQAPAPLRDLLMHREPGRVAHSVRQPAGVADERYGRAALDGELNRLRNAAPHTRNITLNRAAFRCFQLSAAGLLDPDQVTAELTAAARQIGLGDQEIVRTLRSARTGGQTHPRTLLTAPRLRVTAADLSDEPAQPQRRPSMTHSRPPCWSIQAVDTRGRTGTDLDEADLVVPGITVKDILAYQQVGLRILERSRNERANRAGLIHPDAVPYGLPGRDTNDGPAGEEGP